jgi:hypothetical protein
MAHLRTRLLKPALLIESLIMRATIQNRLVATQTDSDGVEGFDHCYTELLALKLFQDGDLFDVAYCAEVVDTEGK